MKKNRKRKIGMIQKTLNNTKSKVMPEEWDIVITDNV